MCAPRCADLYGNSSESTVAERRTALELWLNYVLRTPSAELQESPELAEFLMPVTAADSKPAKFACVAPFRTHACPAKPALEAASGGSGLSEWCLRLVSQSDLQHGEYRLVGGAAERGLRLHLLAQALALG